MAKTRNYKLPTDMDYEAHRARIDRGNLAWKAARARGLDYPASAELVKSVEDGKTLLNPEEVAAEVEVYLARIRCHEKCKGYVRQYGCAPYTNITDPCQCQVCARSLTCGGDPSREHTFVELGVQEARALGIYHAGHCYHVERCTHCGDISAYDSSD